jgi:hypothetical protein
MRAVLMPKVSSREEAPVVEVGIGQDRLRALRSRPLRSMVDAGTEVTGDAVLQLQRIGVPLPVSACWARAGRAQQARVRWRILFS